MIKTLVGKMDGDRMISLAEKDQMSMTGSPLQDDIVEISCHYYALVNVDNFLVMKDVTHAFNLLIGGEK